MKTRPKKDQGPALPLKTPRAAWQPGVFRRKDRRNRLYARLKNKEGKIIIRSTGKATTQAAQEMLALMTAHVAKGGSL